MEDHSHLRGVDLDHESKTLINSDRTGADSRHPQDPRDLLARMKHISHLIEEVLYFLPLDLNLNLLYRELLLSLDKNTFS
jgi:hypothetical protein